MPLYIRTQLLHLLFGNLLISDSNKSYTITIINWTLQNFSWRTLSEERQTVKVSHYSRENKSADYGEIRYRQQGKLRLRDVSTSLSRVSDPECLRDITNRQDRALRVRSDSRGIVRTQ